MREVCDNQPGDEADVCGLQYPPDSVVRLIIVCQVSRRSERTPQLINKARLASPGEGQQELPPHRLITVDVGHELDLGPQQRSLLADIAAQVNTLQPSSLLTCAQAVTLQISN